MIIVTALQEPVKKLRIIEGEEPAARYEKDLRYMGYTPLRGAAEDTVYYLNRGVA